VSVSKPFKILVDQIQRCAKIDSNVLISGEVGTGRRQVALSIHNASTRDRNNFVSINCTGMTEEQFAVDLFGLQNQSFIMVRKGGIFLAEEGTLFLHDVDELSPKMQSLLYRFIDSGYYTPVGSNDVIPANVRIICSTSSNLSAKVDNGQFRNNLFHKLSEFVIKTPNINERRDDLELLVTNILRDINPTNSIQLEDTAFKRLTNHRYTGNLIELKNILTRA
jgi:DNA-binding NtrC family response regulator